MSVVYDSQRDRLLAFGGNYGTAFHSLAALYILGPKFIRVLPEHAARFAQKVDASAEPEPAATEPQAPQFNPFSPPAMRAWGSAWVRSALPPRYRW